MAAQHHTYTNIPGGGLPPGTPMPQLGARMQQMGVPYQDPVRTGVGGGGGGGALNALCCGGGGGGAAGFAEAGMLASAGAMFDDDLDSQVTYQHTVVTEKKSTHKIVCCFGLMTCCLVAAVLVILFLFIKPFAPVTTTTASPLTTVSPWSSTSQPTPSPPTIPGTCRLWGDPHVETFDKSFPNFYDSGEYWVVKSQQVLIQGLFLPTPYTQGLAATIQLAVGGPIMNDQTFIVGPLEGPYAKITFNGQEVLQQFPSSMDLNGAGTAVYDSGGKVVDPANAGSPINRVLLTLRSGVMVVIFRWSNYINVRVIMPAQPGGQDGVCGNFNGDPTDDTTETILARIGGRVPPDQLLFPGGPVEAGPPAPHPSLEDCEASKRQQAEQLCNSQPMASAEPNAVKQACIFDVCFGGQEFARQDAVTFM